MNRKEPTTNRRQFMKTTAGVALGGSILSSQQVQADEAKIIQEIYQGLSKTEQRVEAVETIILDRKERPQ